MKISIIGAGNVGGLTAMRIAQEGWGEVVLIDVAPGLAKAKCLDLDDSRLLINSDYSIEGTDNISKIKDSQIIVITAGMPRKAGMTREDLLNYNAQILKDVCDKIKKIAADATVIIVTNPLDVMTYYAVKTLKFKTSKVFGMGVTLDASRFANLISKELNIPPTEIQAYVMGSHGEEMLPLPRLSLVQGRPLVDILDKQKINEIVDKTVGRGKEIISLLGSGSAYFAPSAAITQIVKALANDEKRILGVSAYLDGEYGLKDVCIGVPCVVGKEGIERIIELELSLEEKERFRKSAESIGELTRLLSIR